MDPETFYRDHWLEVSEERQAAYEKVFQWRPGAEVLLAPAEFAPGQIVVDYGCGPGHMSVELARRVGEDGHVYGVDINSDFIETAKQRATDQDLVRRITFHHVDTDVLPLADGSVDRVLCKNVLEYVASPKATISELRRVLKPGGKLHCVDSDWGFIVAEPLAPHDIAELMEAADYAFQTPLIGRKLYGICKSVGFKNVAVAIAAVADTNGRLAPVIENMVAYAEEAATLPMERLQNIRSEMARALDDGSFMVVLPQFLVTATV